MNFSINFYSEIVHFFIDEFHFWMKISNWFWFTFNIHAQFNLKIERITENKSNFIEKMMMARPMFLLVSHLTVCFTVSMNRNFTSSFLVEKHIHTWNVYAGNHVRDTILVSCECVMPYNNCSNEFVYAIDVILNVECIMLVGLGVFAIRILPLNRIHTHTVKRNTCYIF